MSTKLCSRLFYLNCKLVEGHLLKSSGQKVFDTDCSYTTEKNNYRSWSNLQMFSETNSALGLWSACGLSYSEYAKYLKIRRIQGYDD